MEFIDKFGDKIIVNGDTIQLDNGMVLKCKIGANHINGMKVSRLLSSFNDSFSDEIINIQSGLGDNINTKIGDIKDAYELLKSKISGIDTTDIFELSRIVLETVDEYFGGFANASTREDYYYSDDFEESKNNKISNLKGTGAAKCVERAALAQNLLKSLGINSYYKSSSIIKNANTEGHSYNLIEFNNKYYIFDPSMPNLINNQINPLIAEIDKETFDLLCAPTSRIGISTTVSHYNPYRDIDLTVTYDSGREREIEVSSLGETPKKHL
jgi:hypothetical protein